MPEGTEGFPTVCREELTMNEGLAQQKRKRLESLKRNITRFPCWSIPGR